MPVIVSGNNLESLDIVLQPGLQIAGRIELDEPGVQMTLPKLRVRMDPADGEAAAPGLYGATVGPDSRFQINGIPANSYVVRLTGPLPDGWMLKSAMGNGHDLALKPLEIQSNQSDLVVTLTRKSATVIGSVRTSTGASREAAVLLFPTDPSQWTDYGTQSGRIRAVRVHSDGAYRVTGLLAGEYWLVPVDDAPEGWQEGAYLKSLVPASVRVRLEEGQSLAYDLVLRTPAK